MNYAFSLRCRAPARPTSPVPSNPSVPGSGTVPPILVSPLEIVVLPLKKPLPVLMVNCTVAPNTDGPVPYHRPVIDPVRV